MAEKIIMPKAGMSMESGVIVSWLKEIGDKVEYGEPILEIETDKTTMQVEAMNDGYLLSKLYDAGDEVPVVTTIGYIGAQGEQPPTAEAPAAAPAVQQQAAEVAPVVAQATPAAPAQKPVGGKIPATPKAKRLAAERGIRLEDIAYTGVAIYARDIPANAKATPLAKRVAELEGISLEGVQGSGYGGKIRRDDLPAQGTQQQAQAAPGESKLVPMNGMRKTIARRMLESHTEIPPVTLHAEADVTELAALRKRVNTEERRISFNDLVVKACAVALREYPGINASYTPEGVLLHQDINIGMAVALDDGLIVPVLRQADSYGLEGLSAGLKALAGRARSGGLGPDEYTGGTFTVSNLGMFGITAFTPIINLPESCILGVCAITERLALQDGEVTARKYMGLSLTFDHRCIDGAGGAKFLQRVTQLLENPLEMLI